MKNFRRLISLGLVTLLAVSFFGSTATQAASGTASPSAPLPPRPTHFRPTDSGVDQNKIATQAAQLKGIIPIFVQLTAASASERHQASGIQTTLYKSGNLNSYKADLAQSQNAFVSALNDTGIAWTEVRRLQTLVNGIQIRVDASKVAQIAALPGVKQIFFDHTYHLDGQRESVPFIGAQAAWGNGTTGFTGLGINIAIIDTGIDYRHADFGGDGTNTFPTAKVTKGNNFVSSTDGSTPGIPLDCNGHGTHVAGTAAGFGVTSANATYTGPYTSALNLATFNIGPGVAPEAKLFAYKVFSCSGGATSFDIAAAINQAADDGANVINMSIGNNFGSDQSVDVLTAVQAGYAGISIANSAGNSGDTHFISGGTTTAPNVVSVAASQDPGVAGTEVKQTVPNAKSFVGATGGFGPVLTTIGVSGNVLYPASDRDGCLAYPASTFTGLVALIDRGSCAFTVKVKNAQVAGAIAAIIVNNVAGLPAAMGGTDATITISSEMISLDDGATIKSELLTGTVTVTLDAITNTSTTGSQDVLASFSSRGPVTQLQTEGVHLKPDISAPGVNIDSALFGTVFGAQTLSGTSMASPHIAGVLALLTQAHPTWSTSEIKALAMNTATHDVYQDYGHTIKYYGPRAGAGRVDVVNATTSSVIAYTADDPRYVSVSFGVVDAVTATTLTRNVTVVNKGITSTTYNAAYVAGITVPGVSVSVLPASFTLAGGASTTLTVTLTANPAGVSQPHTHDPTMFEVQGANLPRWWMSEVSGYVDLTTVTVGATELRVPIYAIPRYDSDMHAASSNLNVANTTGSSTLPLAGTGLNTGATLPRDEVSLVTPFQLMATGTQQQFQPFSPLYSFGNIHYVGFTSDYGANANVVANTELFFGISAFNTWMTPSAVIFQVNIIANGVPFALYNQSSGGNTDVELTHLVNLNTHSNVTEDFVNYLPASSADTNGYNTNVMVLPVLARDLGLTAGNASISYSISSFSWDAGNLIDQTPTITNNVEAPVYDFTDTTSCSGSCIGMPYEYDLNGGSIPVKYNLANATTPATPPSILLLHHHNGTIASRSEVVTVTPFTTHLETVGVYRKSNSNFYLRNSNSAGPADITVHFGSGTTFVPVVGDWTGAGIDTIGLYNQSTGVFALRNTNTPGAANESLVMGIANDRPFAGRWTSDMTHDGVGVFRPTNGLIYMRKTLTTGSPDFVEILGIPGDSIIAGDWDGNGLDSPGVYRTTNHTFYLSNQVTNGVVMGDVSFIFGNTGDVAVAANWTNISHAGIGVFRSGSYVLKNVLAAGAADTTFMFGTTTDLPVAGRWTSSVPAPQVVVAPFNPITIKPPVAQPATTPFAPSFDG